MSTLIPPPAAEHSASLVHTLSCILQLNDPSVGTFSGKAAQAEEGGPGSGGPVVHPDGGGFA